jgi:hypothetical protein
VATRVDKQWHLWEPDFRGNETRAALSNILEKSPVSTAVTIYNPEEIAREGIRYVWEENDIAVVARFELPTLFRQDFDF